VLYCAPVHVIGLGVLLLFAPPFGLIDPPCFFDPGLCAHAGGEGTLARDGRAPDPRIRTSGSTIG
jgi:hypothetical protein